MTINKLIWAFKRHPFLYITRFKLLSKNSNIDEIGTYNYNQVNKKEDIPKYFHEINDVIFFDGIPETDLEFIKKLSNWLVKNIKGGPGLSVPSEEALKIMLAGKGGVCSDMAQIFNNFCVINDKLVREWGSTRAPFNKTYGGHSFNEVYCKELNKWVLVDVSYCSMFYNNNNDIPLSVIELYQLLHDNIPITYKSFNDTICLDETTANKNYLNPDTVPFLLCNYSNKIYDKFLKTLRPYLPVFVIHFIIFILKKSYYYRFPLNNYKEIFS
ncbi:transglutaminase domain-containing protein [Hanstruepera ponticola]|uniref:transglutaminase domain-containing protein n=1 Tax=Hanstruepera ponticola TaxID=2042995 RepID=UPI0017824FA1|nr:transglutaminase domain-containing protein [Hanstruepera ponticola]